MRSGKRADMDWIDDLDQEVPLDDNSKNLWLAHLGLDLDGLGRIKQQAENLNKVPNIWGWDLLVDKRDGLAKFGGGHMLRSGKRSFQDDKLPLNVGYFV